MSEIDEIRKRHMGMQVVLDHLGATNPDVFPAAVEHADRGELLAAFDGEWQSERPEAGDWYMSLPVAARDARWDPVEFVHVNEDGAVWSDSPGCDGGHIGYLSNPLFAGALWQRRTVPRDPFAKGGE